ncbi:hypothetical protein Ddc_18440 [Ditylenchus destructor]|nr:hypothetical protein Ddc_18440 [Ditylenchus destructor]
MKAAFVLSSLALIIIAQISLSEHTELRARCYKSDFDGNQNSLCECWLDGPLRYSLDGPLRYSLDGPLRYSLDGPLRWSLDGPLRYDTDITCRDKVSGRKGQRSLTNYYRMIARLKSGATVPNVEIMQQLLLTNNDSTTKTSKSNQV